MQKILGVNIGSKGFSEEFLAACKALDVTCEKVRSRNCCILLWDGNVTLYHLGREIVLDDIAYAFMRVRGKFPLMTSLITHFLQSEGIAFNDVHNLDHTYREEKISQMLTLTLAKLPIPETFLFTLDAFPEQEEFILSNIVFPCVLKVNGSRGNAVWKIEDAKMLKERVANIDIQNEVAMLQKLIPNTYDIRALYFYGEYIGAIKRKSVNGFLNNVSHGGKAEQIELTEEEKELSVKACKALGRDFAGVDIVRSENGPLFFEVNPGPSVYGFEGATGINVPLHLVRHIKETFF